MSRSGTATRGHWHRLLIGALLLLSILPLSPSGRAQDDRCRAEVEPNNVEAEIERVEGAFCIAGELPEQADQDLFLWTLSETDAKSVWSMSVFGPAQVVTTARILTVTSEPGVEPIVASPEIGNVSSTPTSTGPESSTFLIAPGRYLVGISRTNTEAATPPPTIGYELTLSKVERLPKRADKEPNEVQETATPLSGAFDTAGNLQDTVDTFVWTLSERDAESGWEIHAQVALGRSISLTVIGEDGQHYAIALSDASGEIDLYDMVLAPGRYYLALAPFFPTSVPYALSANPADRPLTDLEPNDHPQVANSIDLASPIVEGRLAANGDVDTYRLEVDDTLAGSLFDLRLIARSVHARRLCLVSLETGAELQCKEAVGGAALANVLLRRGHYLIRVSGTTDPADRYVLRLDVTSAPTPEFETEPNDTELLAAALDPATPIRGYFDGIDTDAYRFEVEGEPQLWEVIVTGTNIGELDYSRRDGTELATGYATADRSSWLMSDLYLTPGDHWIRVSGADGEYSITLTPLGPPPPDGEHEANNLVVTAEPLRVGERKTGRLVEVTDVDVFRFSLAAEEHIRLELDGPEDYTLQLSLDWVSRRIANLSTAAPGESAALDLRLLPGDYTVSLFTRTPGTGRYAIQVLREDPFDISDDQEPNDSIHSAQRFPEGTEMSGTVSTDDPYDFYLIPPEQGRDLTFVLDQPGALLTLTDDLQTPYLLTTSDGLMHTVDTRVPDDVPLYLLVSGNGEYTVQYGGESDTSGPNLPGFLDGSPPEFIEVSIDLQTTEIAAYWTEGQRVDGVLTVSNTSDEPVTFELASITSDYHVRVEIAEPPSFLEAGASIALPISAEIEPDAWADIPVRITIAALLDVGYASGYAEITPTAAAAPVNPTQTWPVPLELLGGLDLASPALGAVVAGTVHAVGELDLHDGVAPSTRGLLVGAPMLPLQLTVDLAGTVPAPVRGVTINPQSYSGLPWEQVRAFELQLSTDGVHFIPALRSELSLIVREQSFVLPEPVEATHARLAILSSYDQDPTAPLAVSLGEWSVIASPGYVPDTVDRLNIADPALGGHVAASSPQFYDPSLAESMLTPDLTLGWQLILDESAAQWVIGFAENRAARVTDIALFPATGSVPENQVSRFEVSVSMRSPTGPWQSIGDWTVAPGGDGSVSPFVFEVATWARFVRLSGPLPQGVLDIQFPGQILIHEAPTDDEYRSIIGAWGNPNSASIYELLNPPTITANWDEDNGPDEQGQAAPLAIGEQVDDAVHIGADVDWYRVTVPGGDNTLTFMLTGTPTVDAIVRVYDARGMEVETIREVVGDASTIAYRATVELEADYTIEVRQPPHSIVFAFDTSGSLGGVLPLIYQSQRSFAQGITEGQEFVQIVPFEMKPQLEDWTDDAYAVYAAINGFVNESGSSSAEATIIDSTELLADREGATAILLVTDAETSSYGEGAEMWQQLEVTRPRIFAVHVGGHLFPVLDRHLMQDWSSGSGYYQYAASQGEMDRAFDRAAAWLRRPTAYSLTVESSLAEKSTPTPEPIAVAEQPGTLTVIGPDLAGTEGQTGAQVSNQVTIEIILDTSGSMLAALPDGQRRIDVARTVLTDLVQNQIPPGVPVALRVFGSTPDSCETSLLVPVQPLDPDALAGTIQAIEPVNLVKTPLGASLEQVTTDLAGVPGPKIVVLVTDGEETCDGDPARAIATLSEQGIDATVNIVGFALDDDALGAQFRDWAEIGNGTYFDATSAEELDDALAAAVQAPFRVLDTEGNEVARGTVGGDAIELPAGTYTVVVLTEPEQRFETVVIESDEELELRLEES
jgi:hypothetical protein